MSYESLFEPIKIGRVEIKNRIGMAPMNLNFTREGYMCEQQLAYYAARAKGGTGLIITQAFLMRCLRLSRWPRLGRLRSVHLRWRLPAPSPSASARRETERPPEKHF